MATVAAIYTRVMGDQQGFSEENRSQVQVMKCREFCRKNAWTVKEEFIFVEPRPSIGSDGNRPVYDQMIQLANEQPPPFNVIVVLDNDRFMRDRDMRDMAREKLMINKVKVISVKEGSRIF